MWCVFSFFGRRTSLIKMTPLPPIFPSSARLLPFFFLRSVSASYCPFNDGNLAFDCVQRRKYVSTKILLLFSNTSIYWNILIATHRFGTMQTLSATARDISILPAFCTVRETQTSRTVWCLFDEGKPSLGMGE